MQIWENFIVFGMRLLREKIEVGGLTRIWGGAVLGLSVVVSPRRETGTR